MNRFKILALGTLCLVTSSLTFVSCIKENATTLQASGDIIVQDMKTDAGVKYGLVVYVTTNFPILSGKVTAPGTNGKIYPLTPTENRYQCVFYPQASDYSTDMPVAGTYSMSVTSTSGETLMGEDIVGSEKLNPIVIKSVELTSGIAKISWDQVTGADAYVVRLYSADKSTILFTTSYLNPDLTEYSLSAASSGWGSGFNPVAGTNYVLEILGVKVETNVTTDMGSNLQFITIDSKEIQWP